MDVNLESTQQDRNKVRISEPHSKNQFCNERALGCVFGAFIGDAAGATLEFIEHSKIDDKSVEKAMMLKGGGVFSVGPG